MRENEIPPFCMYGGEHFENMAAILKTNLIEFEHFKFLLFDHTNPRKALLH